MSETPLEPVDDFLSHPPRLPAEPARQESLFQATATLLPRRRKARWPIAMAAAAGIVLALVSAYFAFLHRPPFVPEPKNDLVQKKDEPPPIAPKPEVPGPLLVQAPIHPHDLESKAFDADDDPERVRLYFEAGDLYLVRFEDVQSALRCYQQAIYFCDARDLEFDPNDNWLVMALKRDHRKER